MSKVVLDASALLAHVHEEPGWQKVEGKLRGALISTVNYSEVLKKAIDKGGSARAVAALVQRNRIELMDFSAEHGRARC